MGNILQTLGEKTFNAKWWVIVGWLVVLGVLGVLAANYMQPLSNSLSIPGTEAQKTLDMLEDASMLPALLAQWIQPRLLAYKGRLDLKLDWILGRNVRGLRRGELTDPFSGETSEGPGCVETERTGLGRLSDHSPIFADIRL